MHVPTPTPMRWRGRPPIRWPPTSPAAIACPRCSGSSRPSISNDLGAGHLVAEHGAVAGGDVDQLGDAPDHVVLELVVLVVGEHHLPHHADDLDLVLFG